MHILRDPGFGGVAPVFFGGVGFGRVMLLQSGPLPIINGVITPINGLINRYLGL